MESHTTAGGALASVRGRPGRPLLAALAALALALGLLPWSAAPSRAATLNGHDISWPQCPTSVGGFGLPMPPTSTQFVIVGLTRGLPFTENPCLASQLAWVRSNGKPAHAYTMAAFPTAAQLTTYGSRGPWSASSRAGQLSNVGYAEAAFAVASLRTVGFTPPVVWIDVEPRSAQPWPTATTAQQRENRYVVEGLMRGLRDARFAYGLYSFLSGWQSITGSWRLPGVPVWATAGRLDYPTEALDRCRQASFSGGRVYLSQWYDDVRDYDLTCDPYAFTPLPVPASTLSNSTADFNGDWNNDVLARVGATGDLRLYAGNGRGTLAPGIRIGTGWSIFNALDTPGDVNGDGPLDVLARERVTGDLWLYPGDGTGGWRSRVRVGTGWNVFDTVVGPGDFTGDQRVDLLARETATGNLWLYPGNGLGAWLPRVRVGTGWNSFDPVLGVGDVTGDGATDVLARETATGSLWLYPGNGSGGWLPRVQVGTGWQGFSALAAPGDLNGDRIPDVLARDGTGALWLYPRSPSGGWLPRTQVGWGWDVIDAIL
ncbi:MAG TPA: VCBS repeat-containing protein [Intrasporangium sp.]|uniref:FG-GAP repeat domain-containing protein n=1 Tax=Intrasporangium sp. TaxID=1925024 RepID=UPI002D76F0ED|nr:VCBS repeat-containing protein [Intrasporangium sp.]HET7399521.1 VCBS repeat-containing protein [Intrasporangium sp.]